MKEKSTRYEQQLDNKNGGKNLLELIPTAWCSQSAVSAENVKYNKLKTCICRLLKSVVYLSRRKVNPAK